MPCFQDAAKQVRKLSDEDLDWIGIHTTIYNAQFVRYIFKDVSYEGVVTNPKKKVKTNKPVIIGAGYEPGHSTDMDAVLLAKTYRAEEILNLSNIEYVYDKDPNKYTDAKRIEKIDWGSLRRDIVGNKWTPGFNAPFDPIASELAQKMNLTVKILQGTNLKEVAKALDGKNFKGTVVQ